MKNKLLVLGLSAFTMINVSANDLSIPGEKWVGKFTGYVCGLTASKVPAPKTYRDLNVNFETVVTDSTLDNGVLKATFEVNGNVCRYSAIMLADNTNSTIKMIESKAYALDGVTDCSIGKEILDEQLLPENAYLYYGHPHNMAIMVESPEAQEYCGEKATHFGINFVVAGRINK